MTVSFLHAFTPVSLSNSSVTLPSLSSVASGAIFRGDVQIAFAAYRTTTDLKTITVPTGWTLLFAWDEQHKLMARPASINNNFSAQTFALAGTGGTGATFQVASAVFRGLNFESLVANASAFAAMSTGTDIPVPALANIPEQSLIIMGAQRRDDYAGGITWPDGFTQIAAQSSTAGDDAGIMWAYRVAPAGAVFNQPATVIDMATGVSAENYSAIFSLPVGNITNGSVSPNALPTATASIVESTTPTTTGSLEFGVNPTATGMKVGVEAGSVSVGIVPAATAVTVHITTGQLELGVAPSASATLIASAAGEITVGANPSASAVPVAITTGTLSIGAAPTATALAVHIVEGELPLDVSPSSDVSSAEAQVTTGELELAIDITAEASTVYRNTGTLAITVAPEAQSSSVLQTSGSLPLAVDAIATAVIVLYATGALPIDVRPVGVASGGLLRDIDLELSALRMHPFSVAIEPNRHGMEAQMRMHPFDVTLRSE